MFGKGKLGKLQKDSKPSMPSIAESGPYGNLRGSPLPAQSLLSGGAGGGGIPSRHSSVPGGGSSNRGSNVPSQLGSSSGGSFSSSQMRSPALSNTTIKPIREPLNSSLSSHSPSLASRHSMQSQPQSQSHHSHSQMQLASRGLGGGGSLVSGGGGSGSGSLIKGGASLTGLPSSLPNGARKVGEATVESAVYRNADGSHVETTKVNVARKVDAPHFRVKSRD